MRKEYRFSRVRIPIYLICKQIFVLDLSNYYDWIIFCEGLLFCAKSFSTFLFTKYDLKNKRIKKECTYLCSFCVLVILKHLSFPMQWSNTAAVEDLTGWNCLFLLWLKHSLAYVPLKKPKHNGLFYLLRGKNYWGQF